MNYTPETSGISEVRVFLGESQANSVGNDYLEFKVNCCSSKSKWIDVFANNSSIFLF